MNDAVAAWVEAHHDDLVAFRRHLHAHPELSGQEFETTGLIAERLSAAGFDPVLLDGGAGLVCDLGDTAPRTGTPTVALRADIDGLAMFDDKDVAYRSRTDGVAHACGHDVHTTVVLGAGLALAPMLRGTGRSLRLIFEPAEEAVPGGAVDVIGQGHTEGLRSIYGLHCDPKLDVGTVGTRVGPITSAADQVDVTLYGPGGHTARPHLTVDLVSLASRVALELPELIARRAEGELALVFGSLRAGEAPNVIPTTAVLSGSMRTPDRQVWDQARALLLAAVEELVEGTGAQWAVDHRRGVPPVVNHERETAQLARAVADVLGPEARVDTPRSAGGDSFAWYLEHLGGTYGRLGTHRPGDGDHLDLHSGTFDVDEASIGIGVRVLAAVVCRELEIS